MILPEMNFTGWAGLAVIGTMLATCRQYLFSFWNFVRGLVLVDAELEAEVGFAVSYKLMANPRKFAMRGNRKIFAASYFVRPKKRYQDVAMEKPSFLFSWVGGWPVILFLSKGGGENLSSNKPATTAKEISTHLMSFRGTIDLDKLVAEAMEEYAEVKNGEAQKNKSPRFSVHFMTGTLLDRNKAEHPDSNKGAPGPSANNGTESLVLQSHFIYGWQWQDLLSPIWEKAMEDLALNQDAQDLIEDCERWLKAEAWFFLRRIPWKYGINIYGDPGCGKTSLIRAIAQKLDLPIFAFDLATMTNVDLRRRWQEMLANTPCIPLIEDIDAIFHGRTNITGTEGGVTFDCFLNCIDGVQKSDGILLAITTNDISKIDPALGIPASEHTTMSTRPGRVDRAVRVGKPDDDGRMKIANRILCDWPGIIESTVAEGENDTGAQFQARCVAIAYRKWKLGELSLEKIPEKVVIDIPSTAFATPRGAGAPSGIFNRTMLSEAEENDRRYGGSSIS